MTGRRLTTAEAQALARKLVAEALAKGQAGELDARVYAALRRGLAERGDARS